MLFFLRDGVSREVPCSALKGETVPDSLPAPWTVACQASLSFTITQSLLRLMSIELVMLSNHLILWQPWALSLPDKELCLREALAVFLSRSGGEKGLRGSGAGTLGVPLGGTRRVGGRQKQGFA